MEFDVSVKYATFNFTTSTCNLQALASLLRFTYYQSHRRSSPYLILDRLELRVFTRAKLFKLQPKRW